MNTIDILKKILIKNSNILAYKFHTFPSQSLLQEIVELDDKDKIIIKNALKIRKQYRLPFWDSVMLSYFGNENYSKKILHQVLHHNKRTDYKEINRIDFLSNNFHIATKERLAINSMVLLPNNQIQHILMLDFHIPVSDCNFQIVKNVLSELNIDSGYILNSGESYHFIGDSCVNEGQLIDFLVNALAFAPIIDRAWIRHQLLERSCSLRIDQKHGQYPQVICYIQKSL